MKTERTVGQILAEMDEAREAGRTGDSRALMAELRAIYDRRPAGVTIPLTPILIKVDPLEAC